MAACRRSQLESRMATKRSMAVAKVASDDAD
jgi:hypothetical protein